MKDFGVGFVLKRFRGSKIFFSSDEVMKLRLGENGAKNPKQFLCSKL